MSAINHFQKIYQTQNGLLEPIVSYLDLPDAQSLFGCSQMLRQSQTWIVPAVKKRIVEQNAKMNCALITAFRDHVLALPQHNAIIESLEGGGDRIVFDATNLQIARQADKIIKGLIQQFLSNYGPDFIDKVLEKIEDRAIRTEVAVLHQKSYIMCAALRQIMWGLNQSEIFSVISRNMFTMDRVFDAIRVVSNITHQPTKIETYKHFVTELAPTRPQLSARLLQDLRAADLTASVKLVETVAVKLIIGQKIGYAVILLRSMHDYSRIGISYTRVLQHLQNEKFPQMGDFVKVIPQFGDDAQNVNIVVELLNVDGTEASRRWDAMRTPHLKDYAARMMSLELIGRDMEGAIKMAEKINKRSKQHRSIAFKDIALKLMTSDFARAEKLADENVKACKSRDSVFKSLAHQVVKDNVEKAMELANKIQKDDSREQLIKIITAISRVESRKRKKPAAEARAEAELAAAAAFGPASSSSASAASTDAREPAEKRQRSVRTIRTKRGKE